MPVKQSILGKEEESKTMAGVEPKDLRAWQMSGHLDSEVFPERGVVSP